jgi:hypothetical protein
VCVVNTCERRRVTLEQIASGRRCEEEAEVDVNEGTGGVEQHVAVVTVFDR